MTLRVAHLADLHLGFRQFARATARGTNQREADVADALRGAVEDLVTQRPDLVVIAGDVFHSIRPPNGAILHLFAQLQRLRSALPETRIVIVAGNHDTPRSSDAGVILPLYQALGVDVAVTAAARIRMPSCTVTAVPSSAAGAIPAPGPEAALNVLVLHGDVPGYGAPAPREAVDPAALERQAWDYVALGHYHVAAQVGPRTWYSGALEYTSSDPWGELREEAKRRIPGKGYLLVDLPGGTPAFRPIGGARPFIDLELVDAAGLGAQDLDRILAERIAAVAIDGAVVRLVVENVSRELRRALDYAQVRAWKGRALHLQLELRRPAEEAATPALRAARFKQLDQLVDDFLAGRELAPDVDRAELRRLGQEYLHERESGDVCTSAQDVGGQAA